MSDLSLDIVSGDLIIQDGDLLINSGIEAIRQRLQTRLSFFLGEWFLDVDSGLPYYDEVLKKNPDPVVLDGLFKSTILGTDGVIGIDEFDMSLDTVIRQLKLTFKARTTDGNINFDETLGV